MAELLPNYLQEACYTAQLDRLMIAGLVCGDGVADVVGGSLLVTTGSSGLNLSIAQGGFFAEGDDDDRGVYHGYNDAAVTATATAADPTNPRIDQVIARVYDSTYGEGADEWVLEVLAGTATGGATLTNLNGAAALPDNSVRLAYVLVPATFTGPFVNATHIKDARTEFVSCGAPFDPYCSLDASAATSIPHNVQTKVTLATTVHNDDEFFTVAASVITVLKAGIYDISAYLLYSNSNMIAEIYVTKNGLSGLKLARITFTEGAGGVGGSFNRLMAPLAAGDTIQLSGYQFQTAGSAAVSTSHSATNISGLSIRKVG